MVDNILLVRVCTKCGIEKPQTNEFFAKLKSGRAGLASQCKACANAYIKALRASDPAYSSKVAKRYREKNLEKVRAADRERNARRSDYQRAKSAEWRRLHPEHVKEVQRRWQMRNVEAVREYRLDYRQKNNKRISEYLRKWYLANREYAIDYARRARLSKPELISAGKAAYYRKNKEQLLQKSRAWRRANPQKHRLSNQKRYARMATGEGLSAGIIQKLLLLQKGRCACCGEKLVKYHLDHIMPLALGGRHEDSNMQLLTPSCNSKKGAKSPEQFAKERGFLI